jgi:hypothetical protein
MTTFSERYGYKAKHSIDPIIEDAPDWLILGFNLEILDKYMSDSNRALPSRHQLSVAVAYQFHRGGYPTHDDVHDYNYLSYFVEEQWNHFYDLIELLGEKIREAYRNNMGNIFYRSQDEEQTGEDESFKRYQYDINSFFIKNSVGWRLADDGLLKRDISVEMQEMLEQVEKETDLYQPVKEHLDKAKRFTTQRPLDPENSIKEIASALESLARIYYPDGKTLGAAIDLMKKEKVIPPTLAIMIDKFYGFASEAPNVRHGASVPSTVTLLDAEFCLFAGAAMLRYLNKILSEKSNLSL